MMSESSWLARILSAEALATLRILPRSGRIAWVSRSRACLAEPPALSPSTRKISVPGGAVAGAVGELAGQAQLARRGLARQLALLAPALALLGALGDAVEEQPRGRRIGAEPMVEMVLDGTLDEPRRLGRGQPLLGLALELRVAHEERQQHRSAGRDVLAGRLGDAAVADELAIALDPAQQRAAQPGLVGAAFGGRDGVAIGVAEAVLLVLRPRDRPFDAAAFGKIDPPEERPRRQHRSRPSRLAARKSPSPPGKCSRASAGTPSGRGSAGSQLQRISRPRNR